MGIRDYFGFGRQHDLLTVADASNRQGFASPWSSQESLTQFVWSDILSAEEAAFLPLTRIAALQVPAVSRLLGVLQTTLGPVPLRVLDDSGVLATQPEWTSKTGTEQTTYERTAEIIADCLFDGVSAIAIERGSDGLMTQYAHIPAARWSIDSDRRVLVDDNPVQAGEVAFINLPYAGLLTVGSPTIRGARDLESAWTGRARNPIPLTAISHHNTDTSSGGLRADEIKDLVDGLSAARRDVNGAIGYIPPGLKIEALGTVATDLFENGRNAAVTSIAQLGNVRATMIDGSLAADSSSETYKNAEGERSAFLVFDVPFYSTVFEQRLSSDDIVAPGQRVRFDFSELNATPPTPTGAPSDD